MFHKVFSMVAGLALMAQVGHSSEFTFLNNLESTMGRIVAQSDVQPQNLEWRVGEYHSFDVNFGSFGKLGDGSKEVTEDVPAENAFWYVTEMNLMGQVQKTEALMRRSDGKVLRLIVNGEEQDPDQGGGEVEIIEQYQTTLETPAGTFDCFYIKAKVMQQGREQMMEIWINPVDINLDGTLKMIAHTDMGKVELLLTEFGKR